MNVLLVLGLCVALSWASPVSNPEYGQYYQGDIRLTEAQKNHHTMGTDNAIVGNFWKWNNGIMPYEISSEYSNNQVDQIIFGMTELMDNAGFCVQMVPRTTESDYIFIHKSGSGCWSFIGRIGGRQELSLDNGCFVHGTIMHEYLHAFGFYHEQSRADRDDYVTINYDNICCNAEGNFDKEIEGVTINHLGTSYDYGSVMHYSETAFTSNGQPTIVPHDPNAEIGQREDMSQTDSERLMIHYGCLKK